MKIRFHITVLRRAIVMLVALAWSSHAFCGEIHDAAKNGDLEKVKALLRNNPDLVFSKDNASGGTALHWAARGGHKDVANFLLANKAEVNATNNEGKTALHFAAAGGCKDVAELLVAKGANVNAADGAGATPLHYATAAWSAGMLDCGRPPNPDTMQGYLDVESLLLQNGGHDEPAGRY